MKNTLFTDFKPTASWNFTDSLQKTLNESVDVRYMVSNGGRSFWLNDYIRLLKYFLFPLSLLIGRKKLGRVIAYQQFYGLNFAFFLRLFGLKKKNSLVVLTFIYKKKDGFLGKLYHRYMCYTVTSKYIDFCVCFSKDECVYYSKLFGLPRDKFQFVTLGMETIRLPKANSELQSEKYIFSTGRSNRDYDFLVESLKETNYRIRIACDTYEHKSSGNVIVERNCFNEQMLYYMYNSYCVVIPLKDTTVSSGQLVILQAMQLGKPIIVTNSKGISDYIEDEYSGLIISKTKESLLEALRRIFDDDCLFNRLITNGEKKYEENFSMELMAENIGELIKKSIV